jgi:peptide chain release factor subunit 1
MEPEQRRKLKRIVQELKQYKGRHTELVTVYVPQGYDLIKVIGHLQQEQGTAENIKSASTRKNVIAALERMIQHLKIYKNTPPNGLAAFSGNISEKEGDVNVKVWSIEPSIPLNIRIYRCDKTFVLEPLEEMVEHRETYGLVVMDRREGDIALLKGKKIIPLVSTHSHVPGKFKTGGQSARRFEANRDLAAKEFYRKIAEYMKEQFLGMKELKGILVGGPGPTKYDFIESGHITTEVKKKIIGIKDLGYTGEFGLNELVDKSQDILAAEEIADEKKVMQQFFELLARKQGMVTYGPIDVEKDLEQGLVDKLLISEDLPNEVIDKFEEIAERKGSVVHLISTETREGVQLWEMGGIAAILRYEAH